MKTIYVEVSASDLKSLVAYVSDKARAKSELTEIVMGAPEVFPKSILAEKSIFSMKKMMLDVLANCRPVAEKPAPKVAEKPASEIDFEIMASAIRQICQSKLTPEERVKLIDKLLSGEKTNAPKVATKVETKPATKVAPKAETKKAAKKETAGTPKKSDIMLNFIEAQNGEYFLIDEVVAELNKYFDDENSNKLTAGAFVTSKLAQKGYTVEKIRENGKSWYCVA